jgi:predicted Zn-dependent protease
MDKNIIAMRRKSIFLSLLIIPNFIGAYAPVKVAFPQNNADVRSIGIDIYRQYLSSHKILTQSENVDYEAVNRVGNRVIDAVKTYYTAKKASKELDGFQWEISYIEERMANGWCFPGGKIAIYSSLLPVTQSDACLAVVIAHTIAHVMLKHGDTRMKQYLKQYLGGKDLMTSLTSKPIETKDFYRMAFANGDYVGTIRGFSPDEEAEADQLAAIFCAMSGYKAGEAIVFMERMLWFRNTGRTPEFILSHPVDEKRIPRLKEVVDDIQRNYYKPINKN